MSQYIKRKEKLKEQELLDFCKQVLSALHYLHSRNFIHNDISLGNIFLHYAKRVKSSETCSSDGEKEPELVTVTPEIEQSNDYKVIYKLGDFGLTKERVSHEETSVHGGTHFYSYVQKLFFQN